MDLVGKTDRGAKEAWSHVLTHPFDLPELPFAGEPFAVLLVNQERSIAVREQVKISGWLVRCGCKYAVCTGYDSSTWDDSIDMADVEISIAEPTKEQDVVMTTWHEDEQEQDVVCYFLEAGDYGDCSIAKYLVLFVGEDACSYGRYVELVKDALGGNPRDADRNSESASCIGPGNTGGSEPTGPGIP